MSSFSDHIPGKWSSHPDALRLQGPLLVWGTLLPLLLLFGLGVHLCVDFDLWKDLIRHPFHGALLCKCLWLKIGAVVGAAACGAFMTMALLYCLALVYDNGDDDALPFPSWLVVLTGVLWLVPIGFSVVKRLVPSLSDTPVLTLGLNLLCFLPMLALVLWIRFASRKVQREGRCRSTELLALAVLTGLTVLLAFMPPFEDLLAWIPGMDWVPQYGGWPLRLAWALTWGLLSAGFWWPWSRSGRQKAGQQKTIAQEQEAGASASEDAPKWVEEVRAKLPEGVVLGSKIERSVIPNVSRFDSKADGELPMLMGGGRPTMDQSAFFARFRDSYDAAWGKLLDSGSAEVNSVGCDLLLSGINGSGRTEVLLSAALYAALVRGNGVLFLVETNAAAAVLKAKVDERIDRMMIADYVRTGVLRDELVTPKGSATAPNILFATPERVEDLFFVTVNHLDLEAIECLRRLICEYSTVLVDDFCAYSLSRRIDVAFLMDKWRLVLANSLVMPQFVVAISPVFRPDGARELGKRLFGAKTFSAENDVISLRPRESMPYWRGEITIAEGQDVGRAVREILKVCLDEKLRVVYYSRGMSEREKSGIVNDLESADLPLKLVSHLDEIDEKDADVDTVMHLSLTSGNASPALRLRTGDSQAVFLKVVSSAESANGEVEERLLPLPDETAMPLRVHHLKSVLQFIPAETPMSGEIWSRFGVMMTGRCLRRGEPDGGMPLTASWMYDSWTEPGYPRVAPYLVMEHGSGGGVSTTPMGSDVLPNSPEWLWRSKGEDGGEHLLLANSAQGCAKSESLVEWVDEQRNPLGESDLAHCERLECRTENNTYVVDGLELAPPGDSRFTLIARAKYSLGAEYDFVIPERTLSWQMKEDENARLSNLRGIGGVVVVDFEDDGMDGIQVEGSIGGLSNAFGVSTQFPRRDYRYMAYASGVVLSPVASLDGEEEEVAARFAPLCAEDYSTAMDGFSTTLTHAFSAAIRCMMDGAAFYASMPAFRLEGSAADVGKAVVWFMEPVNSGRALHPLFARLLSNPNFTRTFFGIARDVARTCDTVEKLRMASGQSFKGDSYSESDRTFALELLESLEERGRP